MPTVTIMPAGKTVDAAEGATLLQIIMSSGEEINHKCDGKAECGSCHIFVHEGRKGLSKVAREENERLDTIVGVGSKSRLACQAKILGTENVKVELLGFSSGF
ncbi:MAG: 2Fe-2S iron-sulfur cluster-binding protein [Methylocystis sp.]|uniref:2Fe-2S iron-sulfur cluster-binding protein n=1 Tax=Methylocystis sp. TaxID=1911079 RepID=UPI003D0F5B35